MFQGISRNACMSYHREDFSTWAFMVGSVKSNVRNGGISMPSRASLIVGSKSLAHDSFPYCL